MNCLYCSHPKKEHGASIPQGGGIKYVNQGEGGCKRNNKCPCNRFTSVDGNRLTLTTKAMESYVLDESESKELKCCLCNKKPKFLVLEYEKLFCSSDCFNIFWKAFWKAEYAKRRKAKKRN